MINIQLPSGAALPRTEKVIKKVRLLCQKRKGVDNVMSIGGYSILSGLSATNSALMIVILKPWSERGPKESQKAILNIIQQKVSKIPDANIFAFSTPAIPGLGTTGGFEFVLEDKKSSTPAQLAKILGKTIIEANKQPEVAHAYSTFQVNSPQYYLDINRNKVKKLGIKLSDVFNALQANLGSIYVNDFNLFGKTYKVMMQAEEKYRKDISKLHSIYIKAKDNSMVPLSTFVSHKSILGPQVIEHYNLYRSATINGYAAPGYSSGEAIKAMERVAKKVLPDGYDFEWTGMAYQEILAGNQIFIIFLLALIFIYLFLVAQYESWLIPFAVMFSVPVAFLGALTALSAGGAENNIYTQIGFVLLFGLACKTAILIVEFAKEKHEVAGEDILQAAETAANIRFRAVLMTAISFVLGVFPLVIASGAGAASRKCLGLAVFGGMLLSAFLATILVPGFFVIIQKIINRNSNTG
jgi:HAE1 family hydrophobic/amphiphilic exporter-1